MIVNIGISDRNTGKMIPHTTRKIDASTTTTTSQIHRKSLRRSHKVKEICQFCYDAHM